MLTQRKIGEKNNLKNSNTTFFGKHQQQPKQLAKIVVGKNARKNGS